MPPEQIEQIPVSSHKKTLVSLLVLILVGVGGWGVYSYYSDSSASLSELLLEAMENEHKATSVSYDATFKFDFSSIKDAGAGWGEVLGGPAPTGFSIMLNGSYDEADKKDIKSITKLDFNINPISVGFEARTLGDMLYVALTKAPTTEMFAMVSPYKDKWFSLPYKAESVNGVESSPLDSIVPVDLSATKLTAEQEEHLYELTKNASLIKEVKKLPYEQISGVSTYHFSFDLDREGILAYIKSLQEYMGTITKDDADFWSSDFDIMSEDFDNLKDFTGEIWIGRKDKLTHKVRATFGVVIDNTKPEEQLKINVEGLFTDWDKPISVVAPTESTSLEDMFSGMFALPE